MDALLGAFVPMIPAVNQFFDKILVMSKKKVDERIGWACCRGWRGWRHGIADLSKLEGF